MTEIIERGYGKTFYFHDPNGIRLQIELKTKQDVDSLEGDPDLVPYVRTCCSGPRMRTTQLPRQTGGGVNTRPSTRTIDPSGRATMTFEEILNQAMAASAPGRSRIGR